jgi:hypothetical protein
MIASHQEFRRFCVNLSIRYVPAYRTVQSPMLAVDGGSRECRVHTEVQLVAGLDMREPLKRRKPRAIGLQQSAMLSL